MKNHTPNRSPPLRRTFVLAAIGALGERLLAQQGPSRFAQNNAAVNQAIAQSILYEFSRTQEHGYKWGGRLKVQDIGPAYACPTWITTLENEEFKDCPSRYLTGWLKFDPCGAHTWTRDDGGTSLVNDRFDPDFMRMYLQRNPAKGLNNLSAPHTGMFPINPETHNNVSPEEFGFNLGQIVAVPASPIITLREQLQMWSWLHGESDPWSAMAVYPIGVGTDRKGLWAMDLYHIFADGRGRISPESKSQLVLGATLDYGSGMLVRDDAKTDRNAPYSKIFAAPGLDSNGYYVRKYGIDNKDVRESRLNISELENTITVTVQLGQPQFPNPGTPAPGPGTPTPGPTTPTPGPTTPQKSALEQLEFKCSQYEGGPACQAGPGFNPTDKTEGDSRTLLYYNGSVPSKVRVYAKNPGFQMILDNALESGRATICHLNYCVGPKTAFVEWGR